MKATKIVPFVALVVFGGWLVYAAFQKRTAPETPETMADTTPSADDEKKDMDAGLAARVLGSEFAYAGALEDVTEGEAMRGVETNGEASGEASAVYTEGEYRLLAVFDGLPEPQGSDFYEGWIVRRGPDLDMISTGRVTLEEGGYVDIYASEDDLTDHDLYVLTLEPDDGDPAPADHIVEGMLEPVN